MESSLKSGGGFYKAPPQYSITVSLTNVTANANNPTRIVYSKAATLRFTATTGYSLPATVNVVGATGSWNRTSGMLTLTNPTGPVTVTITGIIPATYAITTYLTNVAASASNPTTIQQFSTATLTFTAAEKYNLPDAVSVTGATSAWAKSTGTLTLSDPTGPVSVTISGVSLTYQVTLSSLLEEVEFIDYDNFTTLCTLSKNDPPQTVSVTGNIYMSTDGYYDDSKSTCSGDVYFDWNAYDICVNGNGSASVYVYAQRDIEVYNDGWYDSTILVYDGDEYVGSIYGGNLGTYTIKSGKLVLKNDNTSEYSATPVVTCDSSITIETKTSEKVVADLSALSVHARETIRVEFKKPTYQVTLSSLQDEVKFEDISTYTTLCTLKKGDSAQTVSVTGDINVDSTSGYSKYDNSKSSCSGDVSLDSSGGYMSTTIYVRGNGSASVYFSIPKTVHILNRGESSFNVYDGTDNTGELKGTIAGWSSKSYTFGSGNIYIENVNPLTATEYTATGNQGVTIESQSSLGIVANTAGVEESGWGGGLEVGFSEPPYQVTLTSLNDEVEFSDDYGSTLCTLGKNDPPQTVSVAVGYNIYMRSTSGYSQYDNSKSTCSGDVSIDSYGDTIYVNGNGSASVYFYTP